MKCLIIVATILVLANCQVRPFRPFPNNHKAVFVAFNDNSGVYRGSSDGAYNPDNSGAYRNNDGQYHPDNSGQYVHSDDKYKYQGDAYKHQADKFGNGGAHNGGNRGNGNYQNVGSGSASASGFGTGSGSGSGSTILSAGQVYGPTQRPGKLPQTKPTPRPSKKPLGVFTGTSSGSGNQYGQHNQGHQSNQGNNYVNQGNQAFATGDKYDNRNYRILKQEGTVEQDGYHYLYETENGIEAEEQGKLANVGTDEEGMRAHGFYTYTGPDNVVYTVRYTADENGFQPEGAHIPTPPPIPAAILRALEYQRSVGTL